METAKKWHPTQNGRMPLNEKIKKIIVKSECQ
jgi:hypothetical protein